MEEYVILVDKKDRQIGIAPKIYAHEKALLHRAFSVFVFNDNKELLLQKRASEKYHSPGLWTNTCCSHQREGETSLEAGKRRLKEEMGFETDLEETTTFIYRSAFDNGLTEHEYDHILVGNYNQSPKINTKEVADWKWMSLEAVLNDIEKQPSKYTSWFKIIFKKFYKHINIKT